MITDALYAFKGRVFGEEDTRHDNYLWYDSRVLTVGKDFFSDSGSGYGSWESRIKSKMGNRLDNLVLGDTVV